MSSKNIFLHIPKTGGTTINCAINKTKWQTEPDFNYRHIIYETKKSNSGDIFNPLNYEKYRDYNIFMLLRDPVDRVVSEYYFIKDREEFISLLKPKPKNIKEYILNKQTNNYMIGFLLGKRMYDENYVTKDDLEQVINTINNLDLKVGIFENYKASLNYFSEVTNIKWQKKIDIKRITLNRPSFDEIDGSIKTLITKQNQLDVELYNYCKNIFEKKLSNLKNKRSNITFLGNKYDYILKYTQRFNLLEIELKNKQFIKQNQSYFTELNIYLHETLKLKNGKDYVRVWNDTVFKDLKSNYNIKLDSITIGQEYEPLEKTKALCQYLNKIISSPKKSIFNRPMVFNKESVNINLIKNKTSFNFLKKLLFK